MSVLAAVDDLFFLARIQTTARQVGLNLVTVATKKLECSVTSLLAGAGVEGIVVDLSSGQALDGIRSLKSNPQTSSVPIIGFASHVAGDVIAAARDAGCDRVLARSAFTRELPELLRSLAASVR